MKGWSDTGHRQVLFELPAEARRNERIREILAQTRAAGQAYGKVDATLEPARTAPILPLMAHGIDFHESRKLITTMIRRFLSPSQT